MHKEELRGEEVEVEVGEEGDEDAGGSLSVPGLSKKHILLGAVLILLAYGAVRWLPGDGEDENEDGGEETGESDGETDDVDISEDVDFSEFEDIGDDESEDVEDEEDLSFEETQERAAGEISEDKPY